MVTHPLIAQGLAADIADIIAPLVESMGYELVHISFSGGDDRRILEITAEDSEGQFTIKDCEAVSRAVSALLEVEDPISGAYVLQVSSPGIDRPLTRPKDFARWSGYEAKLESRLPQNGRRRFRGTLKGLKGSDVEIVLSDSGEEILLPLENLSRAKLVLSDDLIEATAPDTQADS